MEKKTRIITNAVLKFDVCNEKAVKDSVRFMAQWCILDEIRAVMEYTQLYLIMELCEWINARLRESALR